MNDLGQAIHKQLEKLPSWRGGGFKQNNYWIRCPFHGGGTEKTPSVVINLVENQKWPIGTFHCFSCGKHGDWNVLARELKLKEFNVDKFQAEIASDVFSREDEENLFGMSIFKTQDSVEWPRDKKWRSISGKLLNKIGAKFTYSDIIKDTQIYLPVNVMGEEIGGINALLTRKDKSQKAYFNKPGAWSHKALFPYDYVSNSMNTNLIALCEGPRDALNLIQHGLSALAILGTGTITGENKRGLKNKCDLLLNLDPDLVLLMFDPDGAGRRATNAAYKYLQDKVNLKVIKMKEGKDPANLSKHEVHLLKSLFEDRKVA